MMRDAAIPMNMTLPVRNEVFNRAKVLRRVIPERGSEERSRDTEARGWLWGP
jgi:hypothetical protein